MGDLPCKVDSFTHEAANEQQVITFPQLYFLSIRVRSMDDISMKLCIVAQRAGSEIMSVRESFKPEEFELKGDGSPVTVADLRAHQIIEEALSKIHPETPIVSEEGSAGDPLSSELCFLVDPLDGTKEFIRGNGMYTVNIALMERRDNSRWSPILGVVHAPEFGITWFGGRGMGAMRQDAGGIGAISSGTNNSAPSSLEASRMHRPGTAISPRRSASTSLREWAPP